VYDGHGGKDVADYCAENLHKIIIGQEVFADGNIEGAIKEGFVKTDQVVLQKSQEEPWTCGATAVFVLIAQGNLYVGNVGDSEAVMGSVLN
jgi:serine/threonine protein phosphatase PrpC